MTVKAPAIATARLLVSGAISPPPPLEVAGEGDMMVLTEVV